MKAYLVSTDDNPPVSRSRYAWWRFVERQLPMLVIYLMVATLIGIVLAPYMFVNVPSGYVGVLWKRFGGGTVLDPRRLKDEGLRITLPWNKVFLYDLRLQSATETYNAISRDGISLTASINIRFRLKRESVPQLHQSIGPNYVQALVGPEIGDRMRVGHRRRHGGGCLFDQTRGNSGAKIASVPKPCWVRKWWKEEKARRKRARLTVSRSTRCST